MNTKNLMIVSSSFLALAGATCLFAPAEVASALGAPGADPVAVIIQLTGALYLAFAMANWTAKGSMIGGIYARPLSLGNFLHFMVGALSLLKFVSSHGLHWPVVIALALYACFAVLFAYLAFGFSPAAAAGSSGPR